VRVASASERGEFVLIPGQALAFASRPNTSMTWLGDIDLVAIYDKALTFNEIDQNFNAGPNPEMVIPDPLPPFLKAGDANQDLAFDQFDIIQVSQAGKYLTGQTASWGEGDWNGVKGSACFAGNPPVGDGVFNQGDIVAALGPGIYLRGPYTALNGTGQAGDRQTSIVYDADSGGLSVDAPANSELTSINIDSAARIFTGASADNLGGSFDNDADNNIFKATFGSSFGSLSFGNVAQAGFSEEFVLNDLTVIGSLAGGGDLGEVDLIYIPEPSGLLLGLLALAGCLLQNAPRTRKD
jgi:hypothetical protein